jgi:hypothetical protein
VALMLTPGFALVYLGFNAGGYFPDTQGFVTIIALLGVACWIAFAPRPFGNVSWPLLLTTLALAGFAFWTLVSGSWSNAEGRALIEFERVLLYLCVFLLFGLSLRELTQVRWLIWGVAGAITLVCFAALITRLYPDAWTIRPGLEENRLSYPLTYWNALGLLAGVGVILSFHLASRASGPWESRVLGAAAVPVTATTVYLTFSRGAIAATVAGVLVYLIVGRPRGVLSGLFSTVPAAALAVGVAYETDGLASADAVSAAPAEFHGLGIIIGLSALGAALLRGLLLRLDSLAGGLEFPSLGTKRATLLVLSVAVVAAACAVALNLPGELREQYDRFARGEPVSTGGDLRARLTQPGSAARLEQWEVALDEFGAAPVRGHGAGTYELAWQRNRPNGSNVIDAHSLYLEVLAELGIVGLTLLLAALVAILGAFAWRARGPGRPTFAALLAAGTAWALHAGVDWDWELPAVTLWLFAAGGAALASLGGRPLRGVRLSPFARACVVVPVLLLASLPLKVLSSEAWLDRANEAFAIGDCDAAAESAWASIEAVGSRAEPFEILGLCAVRQRRSHAAVRHLRQAAEREPHNWNYRYGLALASAAAGQDPHQNVRVALRLNPLEPLVQTAHEAFRSGGPADWRARARFLVRQLSRL